MVPRYHSLAQDGLPTGVVVSTTINFTNSKVILTLFLACVVSRAEAGEERAGVTARSKRLYSWRGVAAGLGNGH